MLKFIKRMSFDRNQLIGYAVLVYCILAFGGFQIIWNTPPWLTFLRVLSIPIFLGGVAIMLILLALALVLIVGIAWLGLVVCMVILFPIPLVVWLITRVNLFEKWSNVYDLMEEKVAGDSVGWLFVLPVGGLLGMLVVGMIMLCVALWTEF